MREERSPRDEFVSETTERKKKKKSNAPRVRRPKHSNFRMSFRLRHIPYRTGAAGGAIRAQEELPRGGGGTVQVLRQKEKERDEEIGDANFDREGDNQLALFSIPPPPPLSSPPRDQRLQTHHRDSNKLSGSWAMSGMAPDPR